MNKYIMKGLNWLLILYVVLTVFIGSLFLGIVAYSGFTYESGGSKYYIDGLIKNNKNNPSNHVKNK